MSEREHGCLNKFTCSKGQRTQRLNLCHYFLFVVISFRVSTNLVFKKYSTKIIQDYNPQNPKTHNKQTVFLCILLIDKTLPEMMTQSSHLRDRDCFRNCGRLNNVKIETYQLFCTLSENIVIF